MPIPAVSGSLNPAPIAQPESPSRLRQVANAIKDFTLSPWGVLAVAGIAIAIFVNPVAGIGIATFAVLGFTASRLFLKPPEAKPEPSNSGEMANAKLNEKLISRFREELTCPVEMDLLTEAVSLEPCAHKINESSAKKIFGDMVGGKLAVPERTQCPFCRSQVTAYRADYMVRSLAQLANPEDKPLPHRSAAAALPEEDLFDILWVRPAWGPGSGLPSSLWMPQDMRNLSSLGRRG